MKFKPQTYQEIIDLADGINSAGADKKNAKFSLRVAQIKYSLKKHIDAIAVTKEVSPEYEEIAKEARELYDKYATAALGGNTSIPDEKWPDFHAALEVLKKKNKNVEDVRANQMNSYKALLKSPPTDDNEKPLVIDLVEIPESFIPSTLTGNQIAAIMPIINMK
jgi:hypothetical protein